ncbi:NAD(P)-dependent alcohol dehydrogenase [Demequina pelophila]|uniref:NAD(P)-dependent alcohol dehydrogenase n=1 Tax=Demequina pelophila TaxID=1638984 RepID=UPI00078067C1|nr:NAD(P)-dependent alcohol dehydrogenase [Demequina pelophila]
MTDATDTLMIAAIQHEYGGAETISTGRIPVPAPGPKDVLIHVEAAAINPADVFLMRGVPRVLRLGSGLRRPRNPVRGSDAAGTVMEVGASVVGLSRGDRVFGAARGSLAQYATATAARLARLPDAVPPEHAAAVGMAGLAALHGLRAGGLEPVGAKPGGLESGARVLVNGASGGIGHLAVQLAAARGAHVTAVCSTRNVDWVRDLGAYRVVDYTRESLLDLGERFDLVFDNVGNHRIREMLALVADGGTLLPNSGVPGPDGGPMTRVAKAQWINLVTRGRRVTTFVSAPHREDLESLASMVAAGTLRPHLDTVFALTEASAALDRVAGHHAAGKVVVTP